MIIYGSRTRRKALEQGMFVCPNCSSEAAYLLVKDSTWFTLYFIPLFPVFSREKLVCGLCGGESQGQANRPPPPGHNAASSPAPSYPTYLEQDDSQAAPREQYVADYPTAGLIDNHGVHSDPPMATYTPKATGPSAYGPMAAATMAAAPMARRAHPLAMCSLVTGVIGLIVFCSVVFSLPFSLAAIVTGHMAIKKIGRRQEQWLGKGQAIAGLLTGYAGMLFSLSILTLVLVNYSRDNPRRAAAPVAVDRDARPPNRPTPSNNLRPTRPDPFPSEPATGPESASRPEELANRFDTRPPGLAPAESFGAAPRIPRRPDGTPYSRPPNFAPAFAGPSHLQAPNNQDPGFQPPSFPTPGMPEPSFQPPGMPEQANLLEPLRPAVGSPRIPSPIPPSGPGSSTERAADSETSISDVGANRVLRQWTTGTYFEFESPFVSSTNLVLTGGVDRTSLALYSLASGEVVQTIASRQSRGHVAAATLSPDGTRLFVGLSDGVIEGWSIDAAGTSAWLESQPQPHARRMLSALYYGQTGDFILSHDLSGQIQWQATTGNAKARTAERPVSSVKTIRLPTSGLIARLVTPRDVRELNLKTGNLQAKSLPIRLNFVSAFSPDGKLLACSSSAGKLTLTDWETGSILWEQESSTSPQPLSACVFSHDGKRIAFAQGDTVTILDANTGNPQSELRFNRRFSKIQLHFSLNDQRLSMFVQGPPSKHFVVQLEH